MERRVLNSRLFPPLFFLLVAFFQLFIFVNLPDEREKWFFYGRDTLAHDAVVHLWVQHWVERAPTTVPLWMHGLQGGVPTLGAFLWTPLAPSVWPLHFFNYADAQRLGWLLALWIAGIGGYLLGRSFCLRRIGSLYAGLTWMLCGHVVTLIHAGHFQKVMALGWLPWMVAGGAIILFSGNAWRRLSGAAIGLLGLGMMLLSGHPQIAYMGMILVLLLAVTDMLFRSRRRAPTKVMLLFVLLGGGILLGGAQLAPGLEMSGLSNRAGGVSFEEAVETSYPPGEIAEFIIPRFKGSSVAGDVYSGNWGERIVSDYFGKTSLLIAAFSLSLFLRRKLLVGFWLFIVCLSLLIGLGNNTGLYRLLFNYLPGFNSFRSPGTFMAATSLGLAVLAGAGIQAVGGFARGRLHPRGFAAVLALLFGLTAMDLGAANRHFLHAFPWEKYQREFIHPNELDLYLSEEPLRLQVHDAVSNLSLRPLLFGRRALHGYHPVFYEAKKRVDEELGLNSPEWFQFWGFSHLLVPVGGDFPGSEPFPEFGREVWPLPEPSEFVQGGDVLELSFSASPNEGVVRASGPGVVRVREIAGPGMRLYLNGDHLRDVREPELFMEWDLPEGINDLRWKYEPFSWRIGIFASSAGIFLLFFLFGFARRLSSHHRRER